MSNRPRRDSKAVTDNARSKSIELLKRARATGEKGSSQLDEVEQQEDDYKNKKSSKRDKLKVKDEQEEEEEEDEETKKRKLEDFIVDDEGFGYLDTESEDEDYEEGSGSEGEAQETRRGRKKTTKKSKKEGDKKTSGKKAPEKKEPQLAPESNRIQQFLSKVTSNVSNSTNSNPFLQFKKTQTVKNEAEDDMESYLLDLAANPNTDVDFDGIEEEIEMAKQIEMEFEAERLKLRESKLSEVDRSVSVAKLPTPATLANDGGVDEDEDFNFDSDDESTPAAVVQQPVPAVVSKPKPLAKKLPLVSPKLQNNWWNESTDSVVNVKGLKEVTPTDVELVVKNKNDLEFFMMAAEEDRQGRILLFGKIKLSKAQSAYSNNGFASCCVMIENMQRNVFLLPRDYCVDEKGDPTTLEPTTKMVEEEVANLMKKHKITGYTLKKVKRTSCFDYQVPQKNIPIGKTLEVWKLSYPSSFPALENSISGKTFKCAYGITSSPLELFILKRKIMGPSWLTVKNPNFVFSPKRTHCRYECNVNSFKDVKTSEAKAPSPPLVVMSISTKSINNGANPEIVMISAVINEHVSTDGPTTEKDKVKYITAIRPLVSGQIINKDSSKPNLQVCTNERDLLTFFIETIACIDPDVIAGHNVIGYDIEVIYNRLEKLKVVDWSCIGRLKKSQYDRRNKVPGRLICDSYLVCKEFLKEKNYSLVELCKSQLNMEKQEINYLAIESYFTTPKRLNILIELNENDCYVIFLLLFKLLAFPLTKQLTNIAGNLWDKSMKSNRAERIEYLLLHNFYEKKYLLPDKNDKFANANTEIQKYSGGLVLQPKVDFYDRYVVLLDFNSLYPSIIQEFNVCFTTIQRMKEDDGKTWKEAEPPGSSTQKGILPKVLQSLVSKRKEIKKRLDSERESVVKQQLDIQQQAVKLIANSMYGCLGFSNSRFYALPLAQLVTRKGRENLQISANIVAKLHYEVIYGDTDSLMIYTGVSTFEEAEKIGKEIQKKINDTYRGSVLEMGLDAIFKRLLLLKKKKYASLKESRLLDGTLKQTQENKGLDIVRRDWCDLTKDIGQYILNLILSGEERIKLFTNLKEYLENIRKQLGECSIAVEKFIITKSLSRNPEEYNDGDTQPHVLVALEMKKKGTHVQPGDQIQYVICKGAQEWYSRAREPKDVAPEEIDIDWYLAQQILPPIERLTIPLGHENNDLAIWLGMSGSKYKNNANNHNNNGDHSNDSAQSMRYLSPTSDPKFKNCKPLCFLCPGCLKNYDYNGIVRIVHLENDTTRQDSGLSCPGCGFKTPAKKLINQLQIAIREYVKQNQGWEMKCTECEKVSNCFNSSYRCIRPQCRGKMTPILSSASFFNQISFFLKIFEGDLIRTDTCISDQDRATVNDMSDCIKSTLSKFEQYTTSMACVSQSQGLLNFASRRLHQHLISSTSN
ncbi:hypothetical protein CYY_000705 [Polysphondylium violaceum]|uniref:DNA polymerase n=1 Tax=Polysphondylium violaceum TaxID=133409 RepID=A0A8J4QAH3_9MYCE|nr:hypothetical protein CYY_000705 [Polysphondylium violaceum]